jgi:hypothetical protein
VKEKGRIKGKEEKIKENTPYNRESELCTLEPLGVNARLRC